MRSSAASDVYKRQGEGEVRVEEAEAEDEHRPSAQELQWPLHTPHSEEEEQEEQMEVAEHPAIDYLPSHQGQKRKPNSRLASWAKRTKEDQETPPPRTPRAAKARAQAAIKDLCTPKRKQATERSAMKVRPLKKKIQKKRTEMANKKIPPMEDGPQQAPPSDSDNELYVVQTAAEPEPSISYYSPYSSAW